MFCKFLLGGLGFFRTGFMIWDARRGVRISGWVYNRVPSCYISKVRYMHGATQRLKILIKEYPSTYRWMSKF